MTVGTRKYPTWGDFLKKQRAKHYRSAREFCSRVEVGISYPQYSRYEAGDQLPNLDQALKLCRLLEIPVQEGLLEWSCAQVSDADLRGEVTSFLDQVRSKVATAVPSSSSAVRETIAPADSGSPTAKAAAEGGIFAGRSGLNDVMVFNRAHMRLFLANRAYRDIFTYVNSYSPEWIAADEVARAVGVPVDLAEGMMQELSDLGVLLLAGGKCRASKRVFYFPDDPDFFELRNENLRYNSEAIMRKLTHQTLKDRKAYRGLVTRELTSDQLEAVIKGIEALVDRVISLPESKNPDRIYSLSILLGERFCRSELYREMEADRTSSLPSPASSPEVQL